MQERQNDRVSYSFGMKLSLQAKYESADFHISLTSDVNEGESIAQAFNRVKEEVQKYARQAYEKIRESESGIELPGSFKALPEPETRPIEVDYKVYRKQIKNAFSVLESQKKISKADFITKYLNNKKVDQLSDSEVLVTINLLSKDFTELKLKGVSNV